MMKSLRNPRRPSLAFFRLAPDALRLLFPEPYNPINILGFATLLFEDCHALAAVMLCMHRDLDKRLGDADLAGRVGKPMDVRNTLGLLVIELRDEVVQADVARLSTELEIVIGWGRSLMPASGRLCPEDLQESLLNSNQMAKSLSQVFVVARARFAPCMKEDGVRPLSVCHKIA
jgi:hypothetical protein